MQDQPRERHIFGFRRRVQLSQDETQAFGVLGFYSRFAIGFEESLQLPVPRRAAPTPA